MASFLTDLHQIIGDKAKILFIRILYGGSETEWLKDNKLTGTLPSCVANLKNELKFRLTRMPTNNESKFGRCSAKNETNKS